MSYLKMAYLKHITLNAFRTDFQKKLKFGHLWKVFYEPEPPLFSIFPTKINHLFSCRSSCRSARITFSGWLIVEKAKDKNLKKKTKYKNLDHRMHSWWVFLHQLPTKRNFQGVFNILFRQPYQEELYLCSFHWLMLSSLILCYCKYNKQIKPSQMEV